LNKNVPRTLDVANEMFGIDSIYETTNELHHEHF